MKKHVIIVCNNRFQFDAVLHSREFAFERRPRMIVANSPYCCDCLRGMENFTIIFADQWDKNMQPQWRDEFREVLWTRRGVEELRSKM